MSNLHRRIYLASSWRNPHYFGVLDKLREAGHDVYDFRNPAPGQQGFSWRDCGGQASGTGPGNGANTIPSYLEAIASQRAMDGFTFDRNALEWCDTCILALPCGRSAHLELGYAAGRGKDTYVLLHEEKFEPELMYLLNTGISPSIEEIIGWMARRQPNDIRRWHEVNGASFKRPAAHALRALREMVELCVAEGADHQEIASCVAAEMAKATERGEFGGNVDDVPDELADISSLVDLIAHHRGIDLPAVKRDKLQILWNRTWMPDADGVLWRSREERAAA